jgi:hypothetical protein
MEPSCFEACFNLIEHTSKADYENSTITWNPDHKRDLEMKDPDMKYILVRQLDSPAKEVKAFMSFMPTMEDGIDVLYLYEIHLADELQG